MIISFNYFFSFKNYCDYPVHYCTCSTVDAFFNQGIIQMQGEPEG